MEKCQVKNGILQSLMDPKFVKLGQNGGLIYKHLTNFQKKKKKEKERKSIGIRKMKYKILMKEGVKIEREIDKWEKSKLEDTLWWWLIGGSTTKIIRKWKGGPFQNWQLSTPFHCFWVLRVELWASDQTPRPSVYLSPSLSLSLGIFSILDSEFSRENEGWLDTPLLPATID